MPEDFDPFMDTKDAAEYYDTTPRTIQRWRKIHASGEYVGMSYEERNELEMEECEHRDKWIRKPW